jgi:phage I-like protein
MDGVFLSLDDSVFLSLSGVTTRDDGSTGGRYRKEVIKKGKFVKATDGVKFEISDFVLSNWVTQFSKMKKNGVKIPVPLGHNESAEANRGWVEELFVDGDALVMICELYDKDVDDLVKRNDVSVFSPPEWTDGKGHKYVRPIRHIALTPVPVIPGLDEFRPLAASFGDDEMKKTDLKKLGADIGITDELTEENAAKLILSHCEKLKSGVDAAERKADSIDKQFKALKAEVDKKGDKPQIDSTLLSLAHDNRSMKLDALVSAAKVTPAVRDKLFAIFVGDDNGALRLSLESKTSDIFDAVINALAVNDPVKLGEQTAAQKLELDDPNRGGDSDVLVKDAEARAEAVKGQPGWRTGF